MYHYGLKHKSSLNPALIKRLAGLVLGFGVVTQGWACACGCGVFDVGLPGLPVSGMNDQLGLQESQATELLGDDVNPVMSTTS